MEQETERSYGIIPLKFEGNRWLVLLIKHQAGHWAFPKGHQEEGETPLESAKRELFEETALTVRKIIRDTPIQEQYRYKSKDNLINKVVQYFIAEVEGEVKIQEEELLTSRWLPLSEAIEQLTFPEARRVCSELQLLVTRNFREPS